MLKPTTDPNASDARRDVEPRPASTRAQAPPSCRWRATAAWSRACRGAPRHRGAGRARHHLTEEDVLDINYEHSGP
ncbi:hypothetical protein WJ968_29315 [Achromobacter xylosoxidans]